MGYKSGESLNVLNTSPIAPFVQQYGALLLDGGLATELEKRGYDLDHPLWSARLLRDEPEAIVAVHRAYLEAGADCLIGASYQASIPGLLAAGTTRRQADALLRQSVALACRARDEYGEYSTTGSLRPLVAASIGPYGAYLANGAEYRGDYGISAAVLRDFHQPRWELLAASSADLLACETIPSRLEAEVLLDLLQQTPDVNAWISFSCRDGRHISDGTPIADCAALMADCPQVLAVGVNCTPPRYISSLLAQIQRGAPAVPAVVYPNSGETYRADKRVWSGQADPLNFAREATRWQRAGACLIGGCCRTGPGHIAALRQTLKPKT